MVTIMNYYHDSAARHYHGIFMIMIMIIIMISLPSTGENWNGLLADCARALCRERRESSEGCGGWWQSIIFFYSFLLIGAFTMLNLFVAVPVPTTV